MQSQLPPITVLIGTNSRIPGSLLNLHRGGVVGVKPIHALSKTHLLPLARHRNCDSILVGKPGAECLLAVLMCFAHDSGSAIASDVLIPVECCHRLLGIFRQASSDHIGVFDRHHRTLPQERQGRMTGIAEQRDAPLRPALHWAAHHKRPFVRGVDAVNKRLNILMPAAEVVGEFAFGTFYSPGFHLPVIALDYTHEVHKLPAPYWIVQHVAAWPEPIRSDHSR